jgi:succinate dehydrogenase / fumarate reductase cytochrome b subunit
MSTASAALAGKTTSQIGFWESTVGKKMVMAVTGAILFLFVVGHMIGNLQIYLGQEKLDHYAQTLRSLPALLWGVRLTLLVSVVLHITAATQLWLLARKARPQAYVKKKSAGSSYASRTMYWSGPILLAFIIYHILHFTTGQALGPEFREGEVYHNVIVGFSFVPASIVYIIAMLMLGTHLYHGVWSMFQSVGISHPKYTPLLKKLAAFFAAILVIGNISIPVSVMLGILK